MDRVAVHVVTARLEQPTLGGEHLVLAAGLLVIVVDQRDPHTRLVRPCGSESVLPGPRATMTMRKSPNLYRKPAARARTQDGGEHHSNPEAIDGRVLSGKKFAPHAQNQRESMTNQTKNPRAPTPKATSKKPLWIKAEDVFFQTGEDDPRAHAKAEAGQRLPQKGFQTGQPPTHAARQA